MFDGLPWETRAIVKKLDEHGETGVSVDVRVCSGFAAWCGAERSQRWLWLWQLTNHKYVSTFRRLWPAGKQWMLLSIEVRVLQRFSFVHSL